MARDLTTNTDIALDLGVVSLIFLASIRLASNTEYVWTGAGSFTWNGQTWKGIGSFGKIANIAESAALQADGTSVSLSVQDPTMLSDSLTEIRQGRPFNLWMGFMTQSGSLVDDPFLIYRGAVDQPTTETDPNGGSIKIAIENKLIDMGRVAPVRLTSEEQKRTYPMDAGLDHVAALVNNVNPWGV